MADQDSTFLFYDKAVEDNHSIKNKLTKDITIEQLFTSDKKFINGKNALIEFNKLFPENAIPSDLDMKLFDVYLFSYLETGANIRITVIEVRNEVLKKLIDKNVNFKKEIDGKETGEKLKQLIEKNDCIPNKSFFITLCDFHTLYKKTFLGIDILNKNADIEKINANTKQITEKAMTPNADLADPIEQQPWFAKLPLHNYQKRTIKWMIEKEKTSKCVFYNKNDEIIMGNVVYDAISKNFMFADDREKLIFSGGGLIDEVGLGKTYQMIMVSLLHPPTNINYIQSNKKKFYSKATLVICPNQLGTQWDGELQKLIEKKYGLNVILLFTKTHLDNCKYIDLLDADFVITSYNFLANKSFLNEWLPKISTSGAYLSSVKYSLCDCQKVINEMGLDLKNNINNLYKNKANILLIHWRRLVIDEMHELYISHEKKSYDQTCKTISAIVPLIESDYRWFLTATPFDKTNECLSNMVKYVTNTIGKIDDKIFKDDTICEYLNKSFFRRNTKKSVMDEYRLPSLNEKLIWLNFSKTEWMMYNAYMANPNVDKFGVLIRQICCHPKLAEEIKIVASGCSSLEDIEKVMVKHYESQFKKSYAKVRYIEYRIKKIQRKIQILYIKRQRTLLRKLKYKVQIIFDNKPILTKKEIKELENDLKGDPHLADMFDNDDNVDENEDPFEEKNSDSDIDEKGKKKELIVICDENSNMINKILEKDMKVLPNSILDQMDIENNYKGKLAVADKDYKGKKATFDYYNDVMQKLKMVSQTQKMADSDSDSDSDSDDDTSNKVKKQKCGVCMGSITGSDLGVTKCGHIFCYGCVKPFVDKSNKCPSCQAVIKSDGIFMVEKKIPVQEQTNEQKKEFKDKQELISKVGTKLANLIFFLRQNNEHSIIFSQWDDLLHKVGDVLNEHGIKNVFCRGNVWMRSKAIREFNNSDDIKVIMLSSESAASGTNLTKAKNVILLDPVYGTYEYRRNTEWQAIGRAYRMGQTSQVNVVRFIIRNTVEEQIYNMNKDEEAKVPVQTIKFEITDDAINLNNEQLTKLADDIKEAQKKKESKPVKQTKKKVIVKKYNDSDSDSDSDTDYLNKT